MFADNQSKFENVTPAQAANWLNLLNHDKQNAIQRPVRQSWVNHLSSEMTKMRFYPTSTIHFCFHNGDTYLVNGQHTLRAIVASQTTQTVNVVRSSVTDLAVVKQFYYRYDGGLKRSFEDSVRVLDVQSTTGLGSNELQFIQAALKFISIRFDSGKNRPNIIANDDLVRGVILYAPQLKQIKNVISGIDRVLTKVIMRRSELAVALLITKYQPERSKEFLYKVVTDDKLELNNPCKVYNKFLLTARASGGGANSRTVYTPRELAVAMAKSWNAFYSNKPMKIIRTDMEEFYLAGVDLQQEYKEIDGLFQE